MGVVFEEKDPSIEISELHKERIQVLCDRHKEINKELERKEIIRSDLFVKQWREMQVEFKQWVSKEKKDLQKDRRTKKVTNDQYQDLKIEMEKKHAAREEELGEVMGDLNLESNRTFRKENLADFVESREIGKELGELNFKEF